MSGEAAVEVGGRTVRVSSLDRAIWPAIGFTKAHLLDYYVRVAPALLPHLAGRPVTLHRYPEGVAGKHFFQTRTPPHPEWVATVRLSFPRTGKTFLAPVIDDLPSLVWAANLGTLEFHSFLARVEALAAPTALVFDLDPGPPAGLLDACRVALQVRAALDVAGLASVPKTSGGKGLHVFVPLNSATATYAATKALARSVAAALAQANERVTDRMDRALRPGRVFVDWSQNDPGKSTVAPYSLRGLRLPTVSTPLTWSEVGAACDARDARRLGFGPDEVLARVERYGDLFASVLDRRQHLPG